jgi:hypothetical protein
VIRYREPAPSGAHLRDLDHIFSRAHALKQPEGYLKRGGVVWVDRLVTHLFLRIASFQLR